MRTLYMTPREGEPPARIFLCDNAYDIPSNQLRQGDMAYLLDSNSLRIAQSSTAWSPSLGTSSVALIALAQPVSF